MNVVVVEDYRELCSTAADIVGDAIRNGPAPVLGLATGDTVVGLYQELATRCEHGKASWSKATTFNLDEYVGLAPTEPHSYHSFMWKRLFARIDISTENIFIPRGDADDLESECRRYEEMIGLRGPIDLQILGIGINGHIAFNEPGTRFDSKTRVVDLTRETIAVNSRFFEHEMEVPRRAITMGIGTILRARRILLLASGESKSRALAKAVNGPLTEAVPASALQLHHDVTILADRAAARELIREPFCIGTAGRSGAR